MKINLDFISSLWFDIPNETTTGYWLTKKKLLGGLEYTLRK